MDDLLGQVLRGYSYEQLNEAMLFTLVNFLKIKGIINFEEFSEFYTTNLNDMLEQIVKRDRDYINKAIDNKKED